MGSKPDGGDGASMHPFKPIELDTTLYELLAQDAEGPVKESLCNMKPNADAKHKAIPTNNKYLITSANLTDTDDLAHLQLENTAYLLSFWAGPMEVDLVASEGWSGDPSLSQEEVDLKARSSFSVLNKKQRPKVRTFANTDDFIKNYGNENKCRWGFAVDFAERVPSFVHPELQYKLNAKRWLAECRLKSANDQIIDCECKCPSHNTDENLWYFGTECKTCSSAIEDEIARVRTILGNCAPPFVFKLTQCLGSAGTSLIKTESERARLLDFVSDTLRECLPRLTPHNVHIHPTSFVVSDFIPGNTMALNFFIRRDGTPVSLGTCHQLSTRGGEGGRQQTALTWDHQEQLEAKYRDSLREIGQVLHDEGYFGPAGADIMEDDDGTQYVIDLNVRTATSLILGILRGHCEKRRFGACLVYECLLLGISREGLHGKLWKEFEDGRIIILGCTRLGTKDVWAYPVVLAGETQDIVRETSDKILKFEATDSDEAEAAGGG